MACQKIKHVRVFKSLMCYFVTGKGNEIDMKVTSALYNCGTTQVSDI